MGKVLAKHASTRESDITVSSGKMWY